MTNIEPNTTPVHLMDYQNKPDAAKMMVFDHREPFVDLIRTPGFEDDYHDKNIVYAYAALPIGDVIIADIEKSGRCTNRYTIERKEIHDLVATITNPDRLVNWETLPAGAMLDGSTPVLLIEGFHKIIKGYIVTADGNIKLSERVYRTKMPSAALFAFLNSANLKSPMLYTIDSKNSLRTLLNLAKKKQPKPIQGGTAVRQPAVFVRDKDEGTVRMHTNADYKPPNNIIYIGYHITKRSKKSNGVVYDRLYMLAQFKCWGAQYVRFYARETTQDVALVSYHPPVPTSTLDPMLLERGIVDIHYNKVKSVQIPLKFAHEAYQQETFHSHLKAFEAGVPVWPQTRYHGICWYNTHLLYVFPNEVTIANAQFDSSLYTFINPDKLETNGDTSDCVRLGLCLCYELAINGIDIAECDAVVPPIFSMAQHYLPLQLLKNELGSELVEGSLLKQLSDEQISSLRQRLI